MSDEKKRIIDQPVDTELSPGDYVLVDSSSNEGTRQFDLGSELRAIKEDLQDLQEEIEGGGSGMSTAFKQALHNILEKVAYIDEDGQDYLNALDSAMYPPVTAISLNTNSLSFASLNSTQQLTATTTPSGGAVTWSSSNTSVATVSSTGVVTSVGYGSATITATAGSVSATCSVTVAQATLSSISAVYTQSGIVYDTDSLDDLKADLVVTATWSDSSTSTVASTDYTLSGTLTTGTSTITVSYGGKTTTFTVTVTEVPLYELTEPYTFTAVNSRINTGLKLLETDRDFTLICEFTNGNVSASAYLIHCLYEASPYYGFALQTGTYGGDGDYYYISGPNSQIEGNTVTPLPKTQGVTNKVVIRHLTDGDLWKVDGTTAGTRVSQTSFVANKTVSGVDSPLVIGAKRTTSGSYNTYWQGTVSSLVVYDGAFSDSMVDSILGTT